MVIFGLKKIVKHEEPLPLLPVTGLAFLQGFNFRLTIGSLRPWTLLRYGQDGITATPG